MKPEEPVELSPKAREILRAHAALQPPDGSQQRVLSRLEQTLGFPPPSAPPSPPTAPASKLAAGGTGVKAAGLLLILGGLGSLGIALGTSSPPASLPASVTSTSAPPAASSSPSPGEIPPEESAASNASVSPPPIKRPASTALPRASAPSVASVASVAASAPPAASSSPPVSTLAEERALLSAARSALMGGQGAAALRLLNEHAQRFPAGRLSEERESLIIQALARTGNMSAARQRFEAFRTRSPRSIFLPALQAAVGASP